MFNITRATEFTQAIVAGYIKDGDSVIDATMGNGHDTLYLAKKVGVTGKVISFDIQKEALSNTALLLGQHGITSAQLIHDSHENVDKYVSEKVACAMFNLGYLPGNSHDITTNAQSTLTAVDKCLKLLKPNGIISLVVYWGHEEGIKEKEGILNHINHLDQLKFHAIKVEYINQKKYNAPLIVAIVKK